MLEREQAELVSLTQEVLKSSAIEGEIFNVDEVRSSIARYLGIETAGLKPVNRHIDGIVEVQLDATQNFEKTLTEERLFGWHGALFPTGRSGLMLVNTAMWRYDVKHPMQVVSGSYGRQRVHFEAPNAARVPEEMKQFLLWLNTQLEMDDLLKAAIAHLWFVTIHPFDDGNGRLARAITEFQLARSEGQPHRFYSMSAQIRQERKNYYNVLEKTQKGNLNITDWLQWFLRCLKKAIENSEGILQHVLDKTRFWNEYKHSVRNERQVYMLNKLFDGIRGKVTSSRWAKMTKISQDTASRDIKELIELGILIKAPESGRSTHYFLKDFKINFIE
jgi:Fic family protein